MTKVPADQLRSRVEFVFASAGCNANEAAVVARRLVDANLAGHDSHGVVRVPDYVKWIGTGELVVNRTIQRVMDNDVLAIVDGQFGFGQVLGQEAMELAIAKSRKFGVGVVGLRNSGHLGRIGDWAEMAAAAGCVSIHFVNTTGGGILVAPYGGSEARLSANPIAAGVPRPGSAPIVLDISTCMIAEGKIKVALNKGKKIPRGSAVDAQGKPTTDPRVFYGPPRGAILSFGAHKGYGLGVITEILAGALCAADCSNPRADRLANNMLSIVFDPTRIQSRDAFNLELERFVGYVKSAHAVRQNGEVLVPGEIEARNRAARLRGGIELDGTTRAKLEEVEAAARARV